MSRYQSIDALQNALAREVFGHTRDAKKAAGRALGTLVELITFYMIRDWGLEDGLAIEQKLPEYGDQSITHNVEFSLHPVGAAYSRAVPDSAKTFTPVVLTKILTAGASDGLPEDLSRRNSSAWLRKGGVLRHANVFAEGNETLWISRMVGGDSSIYFTEVSKSPFAMFECKRVGVEEGMKKGPQSIEKAKQGAYVARTTSGLQRIPRRDGTVAAVVENADGELQLHDNYYQFLAEAMRAGDRAALENVVLSVGVVSNHGNWFTAEDHNKELKVLAQSYDWLLFLTDSGLAEFIEDVLQGDQPELEATRAAFKASFGRSSGPTTFTKITISEDADRELTQYFYENDVWQRWFNVIAPAPTLRYRDGGASTASDGSHSPDVLPAVTLDELRDELITLRGIHERKVQAR